MQDKMELVKFSQGLTKDLDVISEELQFKQAQYLANMDSVFRPTKKEGFDTLSYKELL